MSSEKIEIGTPWPTDEDDSTLTIEFEYEAADESVGLGENYIIYSATDVHGAELTLSKEQEGLIIESLSEKRDEMIADAMEL